MTESLHAHQIEQVLELGAWRDKGRRFAVGLNGKVSKYEDDKEHEDVRRQRQGAASAPPATPATPSASGAPADTEPAGPHRRETLRERYLGFRPEILLYYPTAHFREVDHGLWLVARIYPLGHDSPCYWVCLFLPDEAVFSPKAFAFRRLSPLPRAVGLRHTNFPDASICAFTDEDDAWRPGDSPKILLNLFAEWLACQLFFRLTERWPGRQTGLDATYRVQEFKGDEWCCCESNKQYGECHRASDLVEVERLRASGQFVAMPERKVPPTIIAFAKSHWKKLPDVTRLPMHPYMGKPPRQ